MLPTAKGVGNRRLGHLLGRPTLDAAALATVQRAAGNRAVSAIVERQQAVPPQQTVQRERADEEIHEPRDDESALQALPPDLEQQLTELFGEPVSARTPTYEVIGGTTGAGTSYREMVNAAVLRWRRQRIELTEAVRQVAAENATGRGGALPVQSPAAAAGTRFGLRWGLFWATADYRRWGDLHDVGERLRRGSPFQRALSAELSNVVNVRNPTSEQMRSTLFSTVWEMAGQLPDGAMGQLVVHFQGHGGGGAIFGVDAENGISPDELQSWARMAQDFGIHLVYVLDTCNVGAAVVSAQAAAATEAYDEMRRLPPEQQQELSGRMDAVRGLGRNLVILNHHLTALYGLRRAAHRPQGLQDTQPHFTAVGDVLQELRDFVTESRDAAPELGELSMLSLAPFARARVNSSVPTRAGIFELRRDVAPLLDRMHDLFNDLLADLRGRMRS